MALGIISLNYEYFGQFNKSGPIFNAKIFIGVAGLDPEILANQLDVVARQSDGTEVSIAQPIRTSAGGYPILNGNAVELLVDGNYAITVLDSNDVQVFLTQDVFNGVPIVVGDDHNLLGNRDAVGAHDGIYAKQYSDFATMLVAAFAGDLVDVIKVETIQHNKDGVGGATYVKDGTTGTVNTGDELQFFDNLGDGWILVPTRGEMYAEQFGADPSGVSDSTTAANALFTAASTSSVSNVAAFGKGTFTISGSLQIPSGDGIIIRGQGHQTELDASSAGSEFDLIGAPSSVVKGLIIENFTLLGSPIGASYIINAALCRNGSTFQNISYGKSGSTLGVNGVYLQAGFYVNFKNSQWRELSGTAFFAESTTDSSTTVNAVQLSDCYFNGCNQNIILSAQTGFSSVAFTLSNCTVESSVATAMTISNFHSVNLINCNFEGNNSTAIAGEATMIKMDASTVNIIGGFYKDTNSGSNDALPFETINGAFVSISDNVTITEQNKTFFHDDLAYKVGIIRPSDFDAPYRDMFKDDHTGGNGRSFVAASNLKLYAEQSTLPISGRETGITAATDVVTIDFNTAQTNEVWYFDVHVGDVTHDEARGGYKKYAVAVMKRSAVFSQKEELIIDVDINTSAHGDIDFTFVSGVLTLDVDPYQTVNSSMRWHVSQIITGRNDRVALTGP